MKLPISGKEMFETTNQVIICYQNNTHSQTAPGLIDPQGLTLVNVCSGFLGHVPAVPELDLPVCALTHDSFCTFCMCIDTCIKRQNGVRAIWVFIKLGVPQNYEFPAQAWRIQHDFGVPFKAINHALLENPPLSSSISQLFKPSSSNICTLVI